MGKHSFKGRMNWLFERYNESIGLVTNITKVTMRDGKTPLIETVPTRKSVLFEIRDVQSREFDDEATEVFSDREADRYAEQIFQRVLSIIRRQGKEREFIRHDLHFESHVEKITWCERVLLELGIYSEYDEAVFTPQQDQNVNIGFKREASEEETTEEGGEEQP